MKKTILIIGALAISLMAKNKYLGTFTIDNYPVKKCEIVKVGSLYSYETSGFQSQPTSLKEKGLLTVISDASLRFTMEEQAIKDGYNAILGYKFYTQGAFDTYHGSLKNGNLGFGIYQVTAQGTPVKIECGKFF